VCCDGVFYCVGVGCICSGGCACSVLYVYSVLVRGVLVWGVMVCYLSVV
jgi:hypothetical protein